MSGGRFSGDAMASPPDIQKQFSALLKNILKFQDLMITKICLQYNAKNFKRVE